MCDKNSYKSNRDKIKCNTEDGYIVYPTIDSLSKQSNPSKFGNGNYDTISNIQHWLDLNGYEHIKIIKEQEYIKSTKKLKFRCDIHGDFEKDWGNIQAGHTCQYCNGTNQEVWDGNRLSTVRPDLIKYFKYKEQAYNTTIKNGKKFELVCPDCKKERTMVISQLSANGFYCNHCSDGISIPEKFCYAILTQLGVDFTKQKKFKWSGLKRYDFYIPHMNMIIETHGAQHYKHVSFMKISMEEQKLNDEFKRNIAMNNNINTYLEIDCRYRDISDLKPSFIESMSDVFDFSNIDWEKVYEFCMNSFMIDACNMLNSGFTNKQIAIKLKLHRATISTYIRNGKKIGIC